MTNPTAPPPQSPVDQPTAAPSPDEPSWYRRTWVVAAIAGIVGIGIGGASAAPAAPAVTETPEYHALSEKFDGTSADLTAAQQELEEASAELDSVAGDLPDREDALAEAQQEIESAQQELEEAQVALKGGQKALAAAEKKVAAREKAVGVVEKTVEANTIGGEGIFRVGVDMKPGSYRSSGSPDCYFAVLGDANGNNILSNNITSGPAVVSVAAGQFFETTRCADWVLQP